MWYIKILKLINFVFIAECTRLSILSFLNLFLESRQKKVHIWNWKMWNVPISWPKFLSSISHVFFFWSNLYFAFSTIFWYLAQKNRVFIQNVRPFFPYLCRHWLKSATASFTIISFVWKSIWTRPEKSTTENLESLISWDGNFLAKAFSLLIIISLMLIKKKQKSLKFHCRRRHSTVRRFVQLDLATILSSSLWCFDFRRKQFSFDYHCHHWT